MPNDVKLQEGHPVDENLRPIKVGGKSTALETAQHGNGAKVNGDLAITGALNAKTISSFISDDLIINDGGDITLDSAGDNIYLASNGTNVIDFDVTGVAGAGGSMKIMSILNSADYFMIDTTTNGATKITTVEDGGSSTANLEIEADGNFIVDAHADIELDSGTGNFIAKKAGTEFSAANSAYAGMILGYTVIGLDATRATFDVTNAMLPVHNDLKVSFVFPPSGKIEILASIYIQTDAARAVTFGLSTTDADAGFTSLGAEYENHTYFADETDGTQHTHRWYVTGTSGDSEELWFAAGSTQAGRIDLFWGGENSSVADSSHPMEYQPFVMKATALPVTTYTG